jgi:hypothetical protein
LERLRHRVEILDPERGVCLPCRSERRFDADVQLLRADAEPDAAPGSQGFRLLDLLQPEQFAEEAARVGLAAGRGRELNVVETEEGQLWYADSSQLSSR